MPKGSAAASLANLKPFPKGYQPENRAAKGKQKALYLGKLNSPEAVEFNLEVMRDPEWPIQHRLRASENILKIAFPAQRQQQLEGSEQQAARERYLQVIFVQPREPEAANGKVIDAPANSFAVSFAGHADGD